MVGEEEWLGRKSGWAGRVVVGKEEWLGRKSGWGRGVVREEEWLGRKNSWEGGVVREEELLGWKNGWGGRVAGEDARRHARLARNPCTHVRLARTHGFCTYARRVCIQTFHARTPCMHARPSCTYAVTVHHARLACTHACIACTPYIHAYELFTCTSACFETRNFHEESHVIIIDYYYCSISLQS